MATPSSTPPALLEATKNSTQTWQSDLQALFDHAKDRFPDVVWELVSETNPDSGESDEVWGHKAVVYARAPPSFQARYFSFRPPPPTSPNPYSSSPTGTLPAQSTFSLNLGVDYGAISRSPSPFHRASSPAPSTATGALLRLPTNINPVLFSNELEYLYTGKGFGEAFEFLFDTSETREEGNAEEARVDKLRKDLVFMWRSRLYSDVKIALTGNFSSSNHDSTTAIFSSHRFMLISRSPYFHTQLVQWGVSQKPDEPLTLNLPSPPFTPASLHFTLGFIYTGTLVFSHRTFDLDTAFHIMRSATYLSLDTLYDEVQARIVQEMMHGLFHAFLEFSEYERITAGKWGVGGCRCRQCARRAPRVLEFSLMDDVKNPHLERGSRRALVGLFGEGWCSAEFARLPQKTRDGLVKGLAKRTTPINVFPLLFASHDALRKLNSVIESWADTVRDMVLHARKAVDEVLCTQAESCFEQAEWLEIMESDGARFEDSDRVEWIMDSVRRGLSETNAGTLYQTLVSSILLRPHPTETDATVLPSTSHIRVQVEQTRMDIIRWLRKRWVGVKQEGGFDALDGWALKEISHEIEVPIEDLFGPPPAAPTPTVKAGTPTRPAARSTILKVEDNDTGSMHSLRASVISRNTSRPTEVVRSSAASVKSTATARTATSRTPTLSVTSPRPDSKLTPSSLSSSRVSVASVAESSKTTPSHISGTGRRTPSSALSTSEVSTRPKSLAPSVKSVQSRASTLRKTIAGPSTLRPVSAASRVSTASTMLSTTSDGGSSTFATAKSEIPPSSAPRSRRLSSASTHSTTSVKTTATSTPRVVRSRPPSSIGSKPSPSVKNKKSPTTPSDGTKLSPTIRKTPSSTSLRSTASAASTAPKKKLPPSPSVPRTSLHGSKDPLPRKKSKTNLLVPSVDGPSHPRRSEQPSSSSTFKPTLKRKSSGDTVTESTLADPTGKDSIPRGSTLEIGIPCIISSKRARFRAYARYIGEVEGEAGPWVGVEVPVGDTWDDDKFDSQQWNDGTWGGIRYFDIGSPSDWEYGEERSSRRRRIDWSSNIGGQIGLKREGDQLSVDRVKRLRSVSPAVSDVSNSETRGLFVRPQQVLYVVDAVA
ncbi:hypothetical protein BXZ70DRAFT_1068977 [Cristinia sonorae]|uniref:BTB domain-containing protein n=1 Tax=Cristinia sonorae TaxID=1940300 RepID=A0A8K0UCL4_9AGAR|nr:hypothetical protein BXZ70DRAFT_1068977 [Cristinia sonorae]